eukprot:953621-Prorocentrum_minimum.AAC.3
MQDLTPKLVNLEPVSGMAIPRQPSPLFYHRNKPTSLHNPVRAHTNASSGHSSTPMTDDPLNQPPGLCAQEAVAASVEELKEKKEHFLKKRVEAIEKKKKEEEAEALAPKDANGQPAGSAKGPMRGSPNRVLRG